jgi:hypothetical protein
MTRKTQKMINFFMWEILAIFFIVSYSPLLDKIPVTDSSGEVVSIVFKLIWILLALFSLLMGLIQSRR